jgi:hypothetical protein
MGQAKSRLKRMQSEQPWCIYCGGTTSGTSVDHMPPISVFDNRHRLKGMEYLACEPCHSGTRALDQIAGLLCRLYPDASTPEAKQEIHELLRGVWYPSVLAEMSATREQEERAQAQTVFPNVAGALNIGPSMNLLICRFAARVGLALHYELCRQVVPSTGSVFIQWYTNEALIDGKFPSDFAAMLGPEKSLHQGSKSLEDQFSYSSRALADKSMSRTSRPFVCLSPSKRSWRGILRACVRQSNFPTASSGRAISWPILSTTLQAPPRHQSTRSGSRAAIDERNHR